MIRNLYIDFTWHSKLPKMLGGEVISNDPKTELLSFVYAFDDCEPVYKNKHSIEKLVGKNA